MLIFLSSSDMLHVETIDCVLGRITYVRLGAVCFSCLGRTVMLRKNKLHQLTFEAIRLIGRRLRLIPDDGHRALTMGAKNKLKPEFSVHLLVSQVCCVVL